MINNVTCANIVEVVQRIFQFFYFAWFAIKLPKYAHVLSKWNKSFASMAKSIKTCLFPKLRVKEFSKQFILINYRFPFH